MLSRIFIISGALVFGVWACVALCNPTQGQPKPPSVQPTPTKTPRPDQTAFVEGRVFDAKTKAPIEGAEVTLEGGDDLFETTTDANGNYRFGHVSPGDECAYAVVASSYSSRSSYGASDYAEPQNLIIPARGIRLDFPMLRRATLQGQVSDSVGRPIKGAHVWIETADDVLTTDANGKWSVSTLKTPFPKGTASVEVHVFDPRFSQVETRAQIRPFYKPGDQTRLSLVMPARAVIVGRLTKRGISLPNALVMVDKEEGMGFINDDPNYGLPQSTTATDKEGRYRLVVSAPGTYAVSLHEDDSVSQTVRVQTRPGQTAVLSRDLKPFPYGSIRGRVLNLSGRPVEGAAIELWTKDTSETEPVAITDKKGRFFAAKVAPRDDYDVTVTLPGDTYRGAVRRSPVRVRSYRTTRVELRADNVLPSFELIAPVARKAKGTVEWRIKARDNQGLSDVNLYLDVQYLMSGWKIIGDDLDKISPLRATATLQWNSRNAINGRHWMRIGVRDVVGNLATRDFAVWVQNPVPRSRPKSKATSAPDRSTDWVGNTAIGGGTSY